MILGDTEGFVDGISKGVSWLGPLYEEFGAYFIISVPKKDGTMDKKLSTD